MRRLTVFVLACFGCVLGCREFEVPTPDVGNILAPQPDQGIAVVRDEDSFGAKDELVTVDFDETPAIDGVVFTDPHGLGTGYCSSPTCPTANTQLFLNQDATIALAKRNRGVLLKIEGMGDTRFVLEVRDRAGNTVSVEETPIPFGTFVLGFRSRSGIAELKVARVGPTPPDCPEAPCGPLALSSLAIDPR